MFLSQTPGLSAMQEWAARAIPVPLRVPVLGQATAWWTRRHMADRWYAMALPRGTDREPFRAPAREALRAGGCFSLAGVVQGLSSESQGKVEGIRIPCTMLWGERDRTHVGSAASSLHACVADAQIAPWYMLKKGRQKQWLWSISRSDAAYYRIDPSRGHQVVLELLEGFEGVLVVDGYSAYRAVAKALGGRVRIATCWSHARRPLIEAEQSYPEAAEALDLIGEMFLLERDLPVWQCITDEGLRARALAQIRETRDTKAPRAVA
jgi:hypothetical protein